MQPDPVSGPYGVLGLTNCTVVKIAAAGVIRYIRDPEPNFPGGFSYFLREEISEMDIY
jgi:hypothetical protein